MGIVYSNTLRIFKHFEVLEMGGQGKKRKQQDKDIEKYISPGRPAEDWIHNAH